MQLPRQVPLSCKGPTPPPLQVAPSLATAAQQMAQPECKVALPAWGGCRPACLQLCLARQVALDQGEQQ
eukprot:6400718-Amphidinium_carterae.1